MPSGVKFAGQKVTINFGGAIRTVTLNAKGASSKGDDSFMFGKPKKGSTNAPFKATFKNGDVQKALAADGLTNAAASNKSVSITVNILFNGAIYTQTLKLTYNATANVSGTAN